MLTVERKRYVKDPKQYFHVRRKGLSMDLWAALSI